MCPISNINIATSLCLAKLCSGRYLVPCERSNSGDKSSVGIPSQGIRQDSRQLAIPALYKRGKGGTLSSFTTPSSPRRLAGIGRRDAKARRGKPSVCFGLIVFMLWASQRHFTSAVVRTQAARVAIPNAARLKGICGRSTSARPSAATTLPRALSDWLMYPASFNRSAPNSAATSTKRASCRGRVYGGSCVHVFGTT